MQSSAVNREFSQICSPLVDFKSISKSERTMNVVETVELLNEESVCISRGNSAGELFLREMKYVKGYQPIRGELEKSAMLSLSREIDGHRESRISFPSVRTSGSTFTLSHFYNRVKEKFLICFTKSAKPPRHFDVNTFKIRDIANVIEPVIDRNSAEHVSKTDVGSVFLQNQAIILSGKPYYYYNGTYVDQNENKYQLSHPRASRHRHGAEKISEILAIVAPERMIVPIRQDSPIDLSPISRIPSARDNSLTSNAYSMHSGGDSPSRYEFSHQQLHEVSTFAVLDADSSSLNMTAITDHSIYPVNESVSSCFNDPLLQHRFGFPSSPFVPDAQYRQYTHYIFGTTTARHPEGVYGDGSATQDVSSGDSGSASGGSRNSCSRGTVSDCSILQSPENLQKRTQSAHF